MIAFLNFLAVFVIDDAIYVYLAYAAAIAAVAGAATSYVGSQKAADAAEDAGKAQQEAANAAARNEEMQAAESIRRERLNKRRRLARLRSQMNAGGVLMEDSSLDVFKETAGSMELSIQDAARSSNMDAANARSQGDMAMWEARSAALGQRIQGYGTLLSSASSTTTSYASTR